MLEYFFSFCLKVVAKKWPNTRTNPILRNLQTTLLVLQFEAKRKIFYVRVDHFNAAKFSVCRSEPQNENVNFAFEVSTPNNSPQPALNHFNCSLVERKHVIGSIIPKGIMSSNAIFDLSLLSIIRAEIGARAFLSPIFCLNSDKRQPG